MPGGVPEVAWDAMLQMFDKNNDGKMSLQEYKAGQTAKENVQPKGDYGAPISEEQGELCISAVLGSKGLIAASCHKRGHLLPGLEKGLQHSSAARRKVPPKHRNGVRLADFWSKTDVLE